MWVLGPFIVGHGVTLVPLGALICVNAGALPKRTWTMAPCFLGAGTMLAEVFGPLSYPRVAHERKPFGTAEMEVCAVWSGRSQAMAVVVRHACLLPSRLLPRSTRELSVVCITS